MVESRLIKLPGIDQHSGKKRGVLNRCEMLCVCNTSATNFRVIPNFPAFLGYLNVNHTFSERTISKRFFDSSELRFWGVFSMYFLIR